MGLKCSAWVNVGATCNETPGNDYCKGQANCVGSGTATTCVTYRSVADGVKAPTNNINYCKYGLFIKDDNTCTKTKTCVKDNDCGSYTEMAGIVVCNPASATGACSGTCAVLAPTCGDVVNDYWTDNTDSTEKELKYECCFDAALSSESSAIREKCKKAAETPKSGASTQFLTTSALLVALVAGFFMF
jgi:hypothetical protein